MKPYHIDYYSYFIAYATKIQEKNPIYEKILVRSGLMESEASRGWEFMPTKADIDEGNYLLH